MNFRRTAKSLLAAAAMTLALAAGAKAVFAFTGTPTLQIPIPGVQFSDIPLDTAASGHVDIPWLQQYIAGIYKYALSVGSFLAGVMVVIGGFQYLTAGAEAPKIQAAKQRMTDAIIGLLLLLGSNALLSIVNPDLLTLSALQVQLVSKQIMAQDQNTLEKTRTPTADAPVGTGETAASPTPEKFSSCPLQLTEQNSYDHGKLLSGRQPQLTKDPRRNEFVQKIGPYLTGPTIADKLQQAGDAMKQCGVHFGSCGGTAGAIYAIAGVGDPSCLQKDTECRNHEKAQIVVGIPNSIPLRKVLCAHKDACCKSYKVCNIDNTGCTDDRKEAIQRVAADLKAKYPGYPDAWADKLKPGDIIWVYNANSDCGGQHSAMFVGWGVGGRANVVQGQWGWNARGGSICVKSSCGADQQAITQVFRAPGA